MTPFSPALHPKACHNCRRQRLKCDQSLPHCLKCIGRGQECLGYQRLFRWEQGVASRGKMVGMTFEELGKKEAKQNPGISPLRSLTDPLLQDMDSALRRYLLYFASDVCKDLVLYDVPKHNPFCELIPLASRYPVLLQIMIATSALRMSNACQKSVSVNSSPFRFRDCSSPSGSPCTSSSQTQRLESYRDALTAKQRALHCLIPTLTSLASTDIDITLAVVLLFTEFELMDSGRDTWRQHINGARAIIERFCGSSMSAQTTMSPLRSWLISNCLVFDILGSSLTSSISLVANDAVSTGTWSLLRDAEGNHCSSFPAILLQLMQRGSRLSPSAHTSPPASFSSSIPTRPQDEAISLLQIAQSFDPLAWATALQPRSPTTDLQQRTHIASAHRAAVCIYLSRIILSLDPTTHLLQDLESLVTEIIAHASLIHPRDALFTATTWPAFIAGAETHHTTRQEWVAKRFRELWEVEPWGLIRGAVGVLEGIWMRRKRRAIDGEKGDEDWIGELKRKGVDWLIL